MKNVTLSLLIFFSFPVFSQTVNPFNLDHVEWVILSCNGGGVPPTMFYFTHYKLCGDTVYNSVNYKKIYVGMATQATSSPSHPYPLPSSYSLYGLLRQDSVLKRNYFTAPGASSDTLLMDYNLNVGDTVGTGLYYAQLDCKPITLQIISTDSLVLGGNKFKVLYTDSMADLYCNFFPAGYFFIEGLGHIHGIFQYGMAQENYCHPFENCAEVDTVTFNCDCSNLSGITEEKKAAFEVYPVPASDHLRFTGELNGVLQIVNTLGEVVMRIDCRNCRDVDVSSLLQQSYLLEIQTEKGIFRRKFIKN